MGTAVAEKRTAAFYSIGEIATLTGKDPRTVMRWISSGKLRAVKIENTTLIAPEWFEAMLGAAMNREEPTP